MNTKPMARLRLRITSNNGSRIVLLLPLSKTARGGTYLNIKKYNPKLMHPKKTKGACQLNFIAKYIENGTPKMLASENEVDVQPIAVPRFS